MYPALSLATTARGPRRLNRKKQQKPYGSKCVDDTYTLGPKVKKQGLLWPSWIPGELVFAHFSTYGEFLCVATAPPFPCCRRPLSWASVEYCSLQISLSRGVLSQRRPDPVSDSVAQRLHGPGTNPMFCGPRLMCLFTSMGLPAAFTGWQRNTVPCLESKWI